MWLLQGLEQEVGILLQKSIADMLALEPEAADGGALEAALLTRLECTSAAADAWAQLQALQDGSDGPTAEASGDLGAVQLELHSLFKLCSPQNSRLQYHCLPRTSLYVLQHQP